MRRRGATDAVAGSSCRSYRACRTISHCASVLLLGSKVNLALLNASRTSFVARDGAACFALAILLGYLRVSMLTAPICLRGFEPGWRLHRCPGLFFLLIFNSLTRPAREGGKIDAEDA